jgi:hypothetical protein
LYGEAGADEIFDAETEMLGDYMYGGAEDDQIHMDDGDGEDVGRGQQGNDSRTKDPGDLWYEDD